MSHLTMSSVEIAKLTGKEHIDILSGIERMIRGCNETVLMGYAGCNAMAYIGRYGEVIQGYELDPVDVRRFVRHYANIGGHSSRKIIDALDKKIEASREKIDAESKKKYEEIYTRKKKSIDDDFKNKLKELKRKHKKKLSSLNFLYEELM